MKELTTFAVLGDSAASGVGDSDSDGNYFGWGYHLAKVFNEPLVFINVSRPGAQSTEVLQEQLPKALIHNPDLIAVIVGGNDLLRNGFSPKVFEENLNSTLRAIEESGATSMLLELHDPTQIVPMPKLLARICRRRVNAVNQITRKMAIRYSSIFLETRTLPGIYDLKKWHVDRMHPSKNGHEFIADSFAHLLRKRGFEVNSVEMSAINNRNRKDSILWMLRNGTPWFLKRSVDLLPAVILLITYEFFRGLLSRQNQESAEIYYPAFGIPAENQSFVIKTERVS
jgi:lysophospholipase L1-like esterase